MIEDVDCYYVETERRTNMLSTIGRGTDHSTFIVKERKHLYKLLNAIFDINEEDPDLGEYAVLLTNEGEGIRVDVNYICSEDLIVFATEYAVEKELIYDQEEDEYVN